MAKKSVSMVAGILDECKLKAGIRCNPNNLNCENPVKHNAGESRTFMVIPNNQIANNKDGKCPAHLTCLSDEAYWMDAAVTQYRGR